MKLFSCAACGQLVFFENVRCGGCGRALAYLPDAAVVSALDAEGDTFRALAPEARAARVRLCDNAVQHGVCNWAVAAESPESLCRACRLNETIPNLREARTKEQWHRLEIAKRRLLYSLLHLRLPIEPHLAFAFLESRAGEPVSTGHSGGRITIDVAEADDPFREKVRVEMGEEYRTLLGHFRHEIGHFYWDRLVRATHWLEPFRAAFGDEQDDYAKALERHYEHGAPERWPERFVSAYASSHPWEDWAETFAHYLHVVDTLETARSFGLALRPEPVGGAHVDDVTAQRVDFEDFDALLRAWFPLTLALNSLNRGMGLPDLYPFVLAEPAVAKLRFVHDVIEAGAGAAAP